MSATQDGALTTSSPSAAEEPAPQGSARRAASLAEALAAALTALAARGGTTIVTGRDPGPAGTCLREFPEAVVAAPGVASRLAVADGLRIGGQRTVIVLDRHVIGLSPALDAGYAQVLVTLGVGHLEAARAAGLTVVQPGWADDVRPLLEAALSWPEPLLFRVHDQPVGEDKDAGPDDAPRLGVHRFHRRGRAGLLVGAGPGAPLLAPVASLLAEREVEVTAAEMHTIRPASGVDPARTDRALLTGPSGIDDPARLVPVPFGDRDPQRLADAVHAALSPDRRAMVPR